MAPSWSSVNGQPRPVAPRPAVTRPAPSSRAAITPRGPVWIPTRPNSQGPVGQGMKRPGAVMLPVKPAVTTTDNTIRPAAPDAPPTPIRVLTEPGVTSGSVQDPAGSYALANAEGMPEDVATRQAAAPAAGTPTSSSWFPLVLVAGIAFMVLRKA